MEVGFSDFIDLLFSWGWVGMQVPPEENEQLQVFLQELNYRYWDETDNPAYTLFLS